MRPHQEMLALLAGGHDSAAVESALALDAAEWSEALAALRMHGLAPLLHDLIRGAEPRRDVPEAVQAALRSASEHSMLVYTIQASDLAEVLAALDEEGIRHLLLKGLALGLTVYAKPWHRPMTDSDLLVPAEDVERAARKLLSVGWALGEEWRDAHHPPALVKPWHPPLELHDHSLYIPVPDPSYRLLDVPFRTLADAALPVSLRGRPTLAPGVPDAILQLTCNFISHLEESAARPLRWVRDFAQLLGRCPASGGWASVEERCAALVPELADYLRLSLALAEPFLGEALTDEMRAFRAGLPRRWEGLVAALPPERMITEWEASPLAAVSLLSKLSSRGHALRWMLRKVLVAREHISRQTGLAPRSGWIRFYPTAFLIHLHHHATGMGDARPGG